jgi:hypothetical protein
VGERRHPPGLHHAPEIRHPTFRLLKYPRRGTTVPPPALQQPCQESRADRDLAAGSVLHPDGTKGEQARGYNRLGRLRLLKVVDEEPGARMPQKMVKNAPGAQEGAQLRRADLPIVGSTAGMRRIHHHRHRSTPEVDASGPGMAWMVRLDIDDDAGSVF